MIASRLVRRARRRAGLSQRALGQAAGIPQSTVARIELGQLSPRVDTLDRLLRAAGQTLNTEPLQGVGIDRGQLRELLALTPTARVRLATVDANAVAAFDAARRT